ncbi:MAG: LysM peptidoglycan-binding domain-containing protein [Flavobacteriaceae bacterium]|nr:LysM peptidoglycan-binding domain-containing protein [Bacteroidia bacterium]NNL16550.1 LysM peptidoglycan-binding domain-containing protein [Flavobacteriaceae bacterium]
MKQFLFFFSLVFLLNFTVATAQDYKTHKVQKGETIYSIAKQYRVTPFDIYKLNPDAKQGILENSVLIIPESKDGSTDIVYEREFIGYKKHRVKRKETLYGLATKYNVTQDEIKKHNTWLYSENLRKGDRLQIPIFKKVKKLPEELDSSIKKYAVKPKEGKWRIAFKFGISLNELDNLNPGLGRTLKVGQLINVPNIADNEIRDFDEFYSYYEVLPKEGFYRLNIKLGLSQDELENLNPELKSTGLKAGMILKVPLNSFVDSENAKKTLISLVDSINNYTEKHIVVMLPFKLNTVNSDSVYDAQNKIKNDKTMSRALDFHSGVLMAIDSAKRLGISIKLDVYDTKNQQAETMNIIKNNNFYSVDAVIGPLMKKNFEKAATMLSESNIPIVSPLTRNVRLYENVFQSRPSSDLLQQRMVQYFKQDSLIKKVFIIHDRKSKPTALFLKSKFPNSKVISSKSDKEGSDLNYVLLDDFIIDEEEGINIFSEGRNVVFLETTDNGFASNVSSILNSLISDEKEIILATTNKNNAFEGKNISNIYLSNLKFHFPSIKKDFDESNPDNFVRNYKKIYGFTPNNYAVRGFDLTMDVLLRLSYAGNLYDSTNLISETVYTENKFLYKKKLFGGYYNSASYIIKYIDLKIVEVQ